MDDKGQFNTSSYSIAMMKILVRLPNWLGDVVMSTAFLEEVKNTYPDSELHVMVKKGLGDLFYQSGIVDKTYEFSKLEYRGLVGGYRFAKKIKSQHQYDLFFCLPHSFSSAWIGFFSGAKIRIGHVAEWRSWLFTHAFPLPSSLHRVEQYINLLVKHTQREVVTSHVSIEPVGNHRSILPQGENLLFNIHSEAQSRRIPIEVAVRMIEAICTQYPFNIILTGTNNEAAYTSRVLKRLDGDLPIYDFTGKTDLAQLKSLIKEVDYAISTDSGIAHLCHALGKKTVVIFGAGDESITGPYKSPNSMVVRKKNLPCAPCASNTCQFQQTKCFTELNLSMIMEPLKAWVSN